jgi:hypothetical protein
MDDACVLSLCSGVRSFKLNGGGSPIACPRSTILSMAGVSDVRATHSTAATNSNDSQSVKAV